MDIQHLNPDGLHKSPAFTQAILVSGAHKTLYIGGQNAMNENGETIGKGDLAAQTTQALKNVGVILASAGASLENVVRWTIYVVQDQAVELGFQAFMQEWGARPNPATISVVYVAGLVNPEWLVEVEAIAVLPE